MQEGLYSALDNKLIIKDRDDFNGFIQRYRLKVKNENPEAFTSFIDENTKLVQFVTIPMSTVGNAVLIVLERLNWQGDDSEQRILKLLQKNNEGKWQVIVNKDQDIIPCATCGGMAGDMLEPIKVSMDSFSLLFQHVKSYQEWVFKYDKKKDEWYLFSMESSGAGNDTDKDGYVIVTNNKYFYPSELKYINLQNININTDIDTILKRK